MLNKTLSLAILFTLTSTLSPYHTHAQNHNLKIDDSNPALMQVYIDDMSTPFANFNIYSKTIIGDSQYRDFLRATASSEAAKRTLSLAPLLTSKSF